MRSRAFWGAAALFLLVLGARWTLIDRYGIDLPQMDQWDAEGREMLQPWYGGHHLLENLFQPHNEHRIVPTRLLALGLTVMNRQWDQRVESVVNALLPAGLAALLWLAAERRLTRRQTQGIGLLLAVAFAGPFAWENTIHGFQSQQWLLILFALGALRWLPFARAPGWLWCCGAFCAAVSLVTMGSGIATPAACAAVIALQAWRRGKVERIVPMRLGALPASNAESAWGPCAPPLAICALLLLAGWHWRVDFPGHQSLYAHSLRAFAGAAIRNASWPAYGLHVGYLALLLWVPWTWLAVGLVRRTQPATVPSLFWFGTGVWCLLQIAATAYARGATPPPPAARYLDNFFLGLVANAFCLAALFDAHGKRADLRPLIRIIGAGWTVLLVAGLIQQAITVVPGQLKILPVFDYYSRVNVRNYLATGDPHYLQHYEIPYPDPASLQEALDVPAIRSHLPASVRPPLALATAASSGFVTDDTRRPQGASAMPRAGDGISPATPPLENARFHGSAGATGPTQWRSAPAVSAVRGRLQFFVAGDLGQPGTSLLLRDARTDRILARIHADHVPGDGWHTALVSAPNGPFVVEARCDSPTRWFAFSDPIEMGTLSYWCWRATRRGEIFLFTGAFLFLVVLLSGPGVQPSQNDPLR